ncbi:MAG: dTDP-4-dehydrorhamnose reductase [Myxococcota bacterium]
MRVLLLGATGMLGRAFHSLLSAAGAQVDMPSERDFDLRRPPAIAKGVDLVICCAAYTKVDGAEEDEELATAVNGAGVGELAKRSLDALVPLINFGTDYVFSGDASSPYARDASHAPLNAYGRSKAAGEVALAASGAEYLQVRTSWLYAPWGNNFLRTMARLTAERDSLQVVDDQRGRPTSAEHLARTTLALFRKGARGIHHATDGGECTWFDFACFIRDELGHACTIEPCTSDAFPRPAKRPSYSVLDIAETERLIGPLRPWQESAATVLRRLPPETIDRST